MRWLGYKWCEHRQYKNATEENLLASARLHPNQQCFHLKHMSSVEGMHPSFYNKCRVTIDDCQRIYDTMKGTLDWVGTTEQLSFDTMPLLQYILDCKDEKSYEVKNIRQYRPFEEQKSLSNRTLAMLSNLTSLDQIIFDQVRSDYVLGDNIQGFM